MVQSADSFGEDQDSAADHNRISRLRHGDIIGYCYKEDFDVEEIELDRVYGKQSPNDLPMLIREDGADRVLIIGRNDIMVAPYHETVELHLDPRHAFGDGRHPTTEICIHMLGSLLSRYTTEEKRKIRMIDVGTGSGILSILASKLGIASIEAIDLSPDAVRSAHSNSMHNGCSFSISCADIAAFVAGHEYDIVVANMVTDVVVSNCASLAQLLDNSGMMIISGISDMSEAKARNVFGAQGLKVVHCIRWRGWLGFQVCKMKKFDD